MRNIHQFCVTLPVFLTLVQLPCMTSSLPFYLCLSHLCSYQSGHHSRWNSEDYFGDRPWSESGPFLSKNTRYLVLYRRLQNCPVRRSADSATTTRLQSGLHGPFLTTGQINEAFLSVHGIILKIHRAREGERHSENEARLRGEMFSKTWFATKMREKRV